MNLKDIKYWHSICLDTFIITTINIKQANNKNNSENVKTWTGGGDQLSPYHFLPDLFQFLPKPYLPVDCPITVTLTWPHVRLPIVVIRPTSPRSI